MAAENSFDIVCKVEMQEVTNALDQARREIETRYDLKGTKSELTLEKTDITVLAPDDMKLRAVVDILQSRLHKRGVPLKALGFGKVESASGGALRQQIVSDGKSIWIYTPELNQVNVGEAPKVLAGPAGSFMAGLGRLREYFTVRFLNPTRKTSDAGNWVLDLRPRKPQPGLTRLVLEVDPRESLVRSAELHDQFDNTVTMRFTKIVENGGLPDRLFTFVPPKGVATVPLDVR